VQNLGARPRGEGPHALEALGVVVGRLVFVVEEAGAGDQLAVVLVGELDFQPEINRQVAVRPDVIDADARPGGENAARVPEVTTSS
jgi:hypothetical protein